MSNVVMVFVLFLVAFAAFLAIFRAINAFQMAPQGQKLVRTVSGISVI